MGMFSELRASFTRDAIARTIGARALTASSSSKKLPRIGLSGPPIGSPMPELNPHHRLVDYLALDADHAAWFRVMERADTGDCGPMMDLFSDARSRLTPRRRRPEARPVDDGPPDRVPPARRRRAR
jgi:hypothetical protein